MAQLLSLLPKVLLWVGSPCQITLQNPSQLISCFLSCETWNKETSTGLGENKWVVVLVVCDNLLWQQ